MLDGARQMGLVCIGMIVGMVTVGRRPVPVLPCAMTPNSPTDVCWAKGSLAASLPTTLPPAHKPKHALISRPPCVFGSEPPGMLSVEGASLPKTCGGSEISACSKALSHG